MSAQPRWRWSGIAVLLVLVACAGRSRPPSSPPIQPSPPVQPSWATMAAQRLPLLTPCEIKNSPEPLLCGVIEVAENRADAGGRRIPLKIVVVPAHSAVPPSDPVFIFEGGPGGAATGRAVGSVYAGAVRARDIVLVDQRGTGGSNPLSCDWDPELHPGELRELFPTEPLRRCAEQLSTRADLSLYTTDHFADDIEEVRQRLGYGPINIRGGSYGTAAMMVFAQRHPESTRTLFGIGLTSPLRSNLAERGIWSDRTLQRLAQFCAADPACAQIAPQLDSMTAEVLARLEQAALTVEIDDPEEPATRLRIEVGRAWLAEQLRLILYFAYSSRGLPWAVHRAHVEEDWAPLVTLAVLMERSFRTSLAKGLTLTVQCSEGMGFDIDEALARGAGTLVGNYRLEQQLQGCAVWPHEKKPPLGVDEPLALQIPTLLLSGALDPVTPPEYAQDAATLFPNSLHLVVAEGQHGPFDLENSWQCVHQIWAEFLEQGSVRDLDTECIQTLHRPPFLTDAESFESYVRESLVGS